MPSTAFWVLVTCNNSDEAAQIGDAALAARRAACFDVLPRQRTRYFWPPSTGDIADGTGVLLILTTLQEHVDPLMALIRARHSDRVPFMGALRLEHVDLGYQDWLTSELTRRVE